MDLSASTSDRVNARSSTGGIGQRSKSTGGSMFAERNIEMLLLTERLCRLLNGGRITSCKSGKDRTSMASTLEFGLLLRDKHEMADLEAAVNAIRLRGVRLKNCYKNILRERYAFNAAQQKILPRLYRPPRGTGVGGQA